MPRSSQTRSIRILISLSLTLLLCLAVIPIVNYGPVSTQAANSESPINFQQQPQIPVIAPGSAYRQTNFVSDVPGVALIQDPLLVNPWGIALRGTSPFWVANNGTSTSTLYRGDVGGTPLVKNPSLAGITIPGELPTGAVSNSTTDFVVTSGMASGAANFIFSSITGNIAGWNSNVPAPGSTTAVIMASHPGHVYTGLATGNNGANLLYAADFANNAIDVFDANFAMTTVPGGFIDPTIPDGFHPYNIQNIGGDLYVAYAKDDLTISEGDNGFVRRFDTNGVRDMTFGINGGQLNAPWGLAIAPASFGIFSSALLVGNFGRGNPSINAFSPEDGVFLGSLRDESGTGIVIDELWGLIFGNGGNGGDPNTLYFAAGIGREEHGLFGSLKPTTASATSLIQFADSEFAISEGSGHIDITVNRLGDASNPVSINYATSDQSQPNHASQKSDYQIAVGRLDFAAGETSQTFRILLVNDLFDENDEIVDLVLSNPKGMGAGLGSPNVAELKILDNDGMPPTSNPIDDAGFFVRQLYLDFLNRGPDAVGFPFWTNQIVICGSDPACIERERVLVAAAFFFAIEFQETGVLDILTHQAAYGAKPLYGQFMIGTQALQRDVVIGQTGALAQLEANKQAYFNEFVTRPEFVTKYPASLTNTQYVDNLLASAGLSPSDVRLFVVNMTNGQEVPPVVPTASGGGPRPVSFGTARLQFNQAQTAMTFRSTVSNIDFTGSQTPGDTNDNLTVAHIHAGPAVMPGVNGPVVWGFFGAPFNDNNPNDQVVIPFSSGVGGQINGKWDAPEGNGTTLAAQLSNLREGRAYVNFHSSQFPGGEVRGNIRPATALRDSLIAGLNGGTETRATVLRKVAEQEELKLREFNAAFVLMEYFGFLRRDPDTAGFNFWLNKLNAFNGDFLQAEMVKAFINSLEYRQRFGA